MNKDKETFYEALENNFSPIPEWKITKTELSKLKKNINKYIPIKDISKMPKYIVNNLFRINESIVDNHKTDIFFNKPTMTGGNSFQHIYDIHRNKYYNSNSQHGKTLINIYRNLVNI